MMRKINLLAICLGLTITLSMLTTMAEGKILDAVWKFFGMEDKPAPPPPPPPSEPHEDGMGMDYMDYGGFYDHYPDGEMF